MEWNTWIRQICIFFLIASLLEHLIAKREYAPYIRLFINLLLLVLILEPIAKRKLISTQIWEEVSYGMESLFSWKNALEELMEHRGLEEKTKQILEEQLYGYVKEEGYQLERAEYELDESEQKIETISLYVSQKEDTVLRPVIIKEEGNYKGLLGELQQRLREKLEIPQEITLSVQWED